MPSFPSQIVFVLFPPSHFFPRPAAPFKYLAIACSGTEPALRKLADALPDTVLHSRADSTVQKYTRGFQRWTKWTELHKEVTSYPIFETHFALYLQYLAQTSKSKAAVEEAINCVSWIQQLTGTQPISS